MFKGVETLSFDEIMARRDFEDRLTDELDDVLIEELRNEPKDDSI